MNKKNLAEESLKTRKARDKLKKKLGLLYRWVTTHELENKTIEIQKWIARHASNRVVLKDKNISLFDENQNAAKLSARVAQIAARLNSMNEKV